MKLQNKFKSYIKKQSINFNKNKTLIDDFAVPFVLITILALFTSALSIYASYQFFDTFLKVIDMNEYLKISLSISLPVIIEIFLVGLLYPSIRMLLKFKILAFLSILPFLVCFYYFNFYTSIYGFKNKAEVKIDNTQLIKSNYNNNINNTKRYYNAKIDSLINSNAILSKKNTEYNYYLVTTNNSLINQYTNELNNKISEFNSAYQKEILENKKEVEKTGSDNYTWILINQIAQVVLHLLICCFYYIAYKDIETVEEQVNNAAIPIAQALNNALLENTINYTKNLENTIKTSFSEVFKNTNIPQKNVKLNSAYKDNTSTHNSNKEEEHEGEGLLTDKLSGLLKNYRNGEVDFS